MERCPTCDIRHEERYLVEIGRILKDWPEDRKERMKERIKEYQKNQSISIISTTQAQESSKEKKERKKLITIMAYEAI